MDFYKLVIVEDVEQIRNALCECIDWKSWGYEVVGVFENGRVAYDFIEKNPCDLVLTDVMMNLMTGLELAEKLKERNPMIKIIVLSGYNDFSYVKKAVQCKVEDYLLKPIDDEELYDVFRKIKGLLDSERENNVIVKKDEVKKESIDAEFYSKVLIAALGIEDDMQLERIISDILKNIKNVELKEIISFMEILYSRVLDEYQKRKMDIKVLMNDKKGYKNLTEKISIEEVLNIIKNDLVQLCSELLKMEEIYRTYRKGIVGAVIKYVEENVESDLGVDVVALKMGVHPNYLSRVFKEKTGEKLTDYIIRSRMKGVVALMRTGEYNISNISDMMKFSSASYMSVQFKRYTGYSPSEYCYRVVKE